MRESTLLTLEERVGQLFLLGFQGTHPDRDTEARFGRIRPGGFVLSQRNFDSLDQIHGLNTALSLGAEIPPFLAIEHEGGPVDRLKQAVCPAPSLGDLADSGTTFVRSGARLLARAIRSAGFNTSLSPVLDLGLPGSVVRERSLAAGSGEVTRLARIQIAEFRKKHLLVSGAHFPGLGGARRDPHFSLPEIRRTRRELLTGDVVPFFNLQAQLDMIRVSHGHYPSLGDLRALPASMSRRVVTDLLRGTLGYQGIIMTDDLTMGAISSRGLTAQTFLDALKAGNDVLLFGQATPLVDRAFDLICETASRDAFLRGQLEASSDRILRLKQCQPGLEPPRFRPHARSRLIRQITRLQHAIPEVDRVEVT